MEKNLILTAAVGYQFNQIEFFIKSLRKYYFEDICFIIGNKDFELESGLKKYDCKIIKTNGQASPFWIKCKKRNKYSYEK